MCYGKDADEQKIDGVDKKGSDDITLEVLTEYLTEAKNRNPKGQDNINTKLWKYVSTLLYLRLLRSFNRFGKLSIIRTDCQRAIVILLFKKGNKNS